MDEIWKDIIGLESLYQISNLGNVRNSKTLKIIKQQLSTKKYKQFTIRINKKQNCYKTHREVARCFLGVSDLQVHHKDENKQNNSLLNLCYVTNRENNTDYIGRRKKGMVGVYYHKRNRQFEARICIKKHRYYLGSFFNEKDANEAYLKALSNYKNHDILPERQFKNARGIKKGQNHE